MPEDERNTCLLAAERAQPNTSGAGGVRGLLGLLMASTLVGGLFVFV